jgi:hypothetical protein
MTKSSSVEVKWEGKALLKRLRLAQQDGVNETLRETAIEARRLVHRDTGELAGDIEARKAKVNARGAWGYVGAWNTEHAGVQEYLPPSMGGKSYIRAAGDSKFGRLRGHVAKACLRRRKG